MMSDSNFYEKIKDNPPIDLEEGEKIVGCIGYIVKDVDGGFIALSQYFPTAVREGCTQEKAVRDLVLAIQSLMETEEEKEIYLKDETEVPRWLAKKAIANFIKENPRCTTSDIIYELELDPLYVTDLLRELTKEEVVFSKEIESKKKIYKVAKLYKRGEVSHNDAKNDVARYIQNCRGCLTGDIAFDLELDPFYVIEIIAELYGINKEE